MPLRRPDDTHRHAIYGMTGSGKTVFGLWCLSERSYDKKPWIIVDFKRDPLIKEIPNLNELDVDERIPKRAGLYVVRPHPGDVDEGKVTDFFYRVWAAEKTGLFIDETYMLKQFDRGLRAVLTQGRSKQIPVIALSQKPSWISPFIHSESEFKSVFFLQMPNDIERVKEWLPDRDGNGDRVNPGRLPDHHSYWYGVHGREFAYLGPCAPPARVLEIFDRRKVRRHFF
jgi:hypothetical protein